MINVRHSQERGGSSMGWLQSQHSFSFADYYDPNFMGFSSLRVINDDWIAPATGFPLHPHRDMEIISYIIAGEIEHQDSMGNSNILRAGMVQTMSAGSGIVHSEMNPSATQPLQLLQIWIQPNQKGLTPSYQQQDFSHTEGLSLLVSPDGHDDSLPIHQDAYLYKLKTRSEQSYSFKQQRQGYLQLVAGEIMVNGIPLQAGDGAAITDESHIQIEILNDSCVEALLFDLKR
ncbi:MAG: pirin family protein [Motiliproteus sp.]